MTTKWEGTWERRPVREIFDILPGKRMLRSTLGEEEGKLPFVSSTEKNNGITKFVSESNENQTANSNVLAVNYNGSIGSCFYHPYRAIFSDDVKVLSLRGAKGDRNILLFFKTLILKQKNESDYPYRFSSNRIMDQEIEVPVGEDGKIDYAYMEERVGDIFKEKEREYRNWAEKKLSSIHKADIPPLEKVKWTRFEIKEICEITSGEFHTRVEKANEKAKIPYVTSTAYDNGIGTFVEGKEESYTKGAISINRTGSVGKAFYHPYGARFSYNVRILKLKDAKEADEGACLFICNQLMEMAKNYNYGRLLGTERLGKESIYLPEKDGKPDFEYMSKYIDNIMIEKYEKYLSWSEEKNRE